MENYDSDVYDLTGPAYSETFSMLYVNSDRRSTVLTNTYDEGATLTQVSDLFRDFLAAAGYVVDDVLVNNVEDGSFITIRVKY